MAYVGVFSPADSDENEPFALDFRRELLRGETIVSGLFSVSVIDGADDSPAAHFVGPAVIDGTRIAQRIAGLSPGVTYRLEARATTNKGNVKTLWGRVSCVS